MKNRHRSYNGLGYCLYCGSTDGLQKEHIYPYALGGNIVFQEASCPVCAEETKAFEGRVAGKMLLHHRLQLSFPRKNKKKKKTPSHFPVMIHNSESKTVKFIRAYETPIMPVFLPVFGVPGLISGRAPSLQDSYSVTKWQLDSPQQFALARKISSNPNDNLQFQEDPIDAVALSRMLAKVAHATAVLKYRGAIKKPLLPEYILGKNKNISYVVGSVNGPHHLDDLNPNSPWLMQLTIYDMASGARYLTGVIQILRHLCMVNGGRSVRQTPYWIVIAEAGDELEELVLRRRN